MSAHKDNIPALVRQLLKKIGENPDREGLLETPHRVSRAYNEMFAGYEQTARGVVKDALFDAEDAAGSAMVFVKDIEFYSLCEHHMLPFFGRATIAYLPGKRILGLSKFARVTDVFARRLQVQERLTTQIADALEEMLEPQGLAVVTEASHLCMMMRGVEKQDSRTRVSVMRGLFRSDARTRQEFLHALGPN